MKSIITRLAAVAVTGLTLAASVAVAPAAVAAPGDWRVFTSSGGVTIASHTSEESFLSSLSAASGAAHGDGGPLATARQDDLEPLVARPGDDPQSVTVASSTSQDGVRADVVSLSADATGDANGLASAASLTTPALSTYLPASAHAAFVADLTARTDATVAAIDQAISDLADSNPALTDRLTDARSRLTGIPSTALTSPAAVLTDVASRSVATAAGPQSESTLTVGRLTLVSGLIEVHEWSSTLAVRISGDAPVYAEDTAPFFVTTVGLPVALDGAGRVVGLDLDALGVSPSERSLLADTSASFAALLDAGLAARVNTGTATSSGTTTFGPVLQALINPPSARQADGRPALFITLGPTSANAERTVAAAPVDPAPVDPPVDPAPVDPAPVDPPVDPAPAPVIPPAPAPVEPAPSAPFEPAPAPVFVPAPPPPPFEPAPPVPPAPADPAPAPVVIPPAPAPAQTAPNALLVASPAPGTGVREGGRIDYGIYVANPSAETVTVTVHLPTPPGTVLEAARAAEVGGTVRDVPVTAAGVTTTLTVAPGTQALLSVTARVTAPAGSTITATAFVDGAATNTVTHPVVTADAPDCADAAPGVLCGGGGTVGLPVPTVCWASITVTSQDPGAPPVTNTDRNDSLGVGVVAEGCGTEIRTAPDANSLLDEKLFVASPDPTEEGQVVLTRKPGLADGRYTLGVEQRNVNCVLDASGVVLACATPFLASATSAERTLVSARPAPVTPPTPTAPPVTPPVTPIVPPITPTAPPVTPPAVTPPVTVQAGGGSAAASRQATPALVAGAAVTLLVAVALTVAGRRRREDAAE